MWCLIVNTISCRIANLEGLILLGALFSHSVHQQYSESAREQKRTTPEETKFLKVKWNLLEKYQMIYSSCVLISSLDFPLLWVFHLFFYIDMLFTQYTVVSSACFICIHSKCHLKFLTNPRWTFLPFFSAGKSINQSFEPIDYYRLRIICLQRYRWNFSTIISTSSFYWDNFVVVRVHLTEKSPRTSFCGLGTAMFSTLRNANKISLTSNALRC